MTALFGRWIITSLVAVACTSADAAVIYECDDPKDSQDYSDIIYIPDPIADNTQSFAANTLRVTTVDTFGEPVCCSAHAIIEVVHDNGQSRTCFRLSSNGQDGFQWVYAKDAIAVDAPGKEEQYLFVPVRHYDGGGTGDEKVELLRLLISFKDGTATLAP